MKLGTLKPPEGSKRRKKRVGRGIGSGHGKTACRGTKGQRSRSGRGIPPGFEGGQMPLQRRVPKRGFTNVFKKKFALVNIGDLNRFKANSIVDVETLRKAGLVKKVHDGVKILGGGRITIPLILRVHRVSKGAAEKIVAAEGKIEVL
ncbi:MAG: 50S ribosomal protein L15 [Syntrophobacterales bacterium]|nr:MAG: 50S ribosomal protein L15 [Syntrophobacterales bacterium]